MGRCGDATRVMVLAFSLVAGPAGAEGLWLATATGTFDVPVRSMQELKFTETIRQGFDFSCGSAALATLLTYHYDREMNEFEIFKRMWDNGDQEKIKNDGFSMLDMKRLLEVEGLQADGFSIEPTKIGEVGVAGIVLLAELDSPHFVVVIGERDEELLISDPARGIWNLSVEELGELWNGVFFVIRGQATVARANFNDTDTWQRRRWSPVGDERLLGMIAPEPLDLPLPSEFNVN